MLKFRICLIPVPGSASQFSTILLVVASQVTHAALTKDGEALVRQVAMPDASLSASVKSEVIPGGNVNCMLLVAVAAAVLSNILPDTLTTVSFLEYNAVYMVVIVSVAVFLVTVGEYIPFCCMNGYQFTPSDQ